MKLQYEELKKENLIITSSLEDIQKDLDAEKLESKKYEVKYGVINSQLEVLNEKNKNEKTSIQSEFDLCKLEFEEHKLIPFHEYILLKDWMPAEFKKFKLELLYKATRDDFLAKTFHNKVNNIANTLTIVTIENGNRIGGFTPLKFKSSNSYKGDNSLKTFIFSLTKKVKFTLQEDQKQNAINDYTGDGPCFGDFDLIIRTESNLDTDIEFFNKCNIQNSFKNESLHIKNDTDEAKEFMTGSERFKTIEIETFRVISI